MTALTCVLNSWTMMWLSKEVKHLPKKDGSLSINISSIDINLALAANFFGHTCVI